MNNLEFLIYLIMGFSTIACLLTSFYYFKLVGELYAIGDSNRFEAIFACVALAYAMVKNTIPLNPDMTQHAILLQEVFRLLIPIMFSVIAIRMSEFIHKYESHKLSYTGIDRRHNQRGVQ